MSTTYPDRAMISFVRDAIEAEDVHATELATRFTFRNRFHHCLRVSTIAREIARGEEANEEVAALAGLFHDAGKQAGKNHAAVSADLCRKYLKSIDYPSKRAKVIIDCVRHHSASIPFDDGHYPEDLAILRDADALDEVGAVGIAWTLLASGEKRPDSYYAPLGRLGEVHLASDGASHGGAMRTPTGRTMMEQRRRRELEFIRHLTEELYVDSVVPLIESPTT